MLTKENIKNIYSLSPMQEGMLFHSLYNPKSNAYFEQLIITLDIESDSIIFEEAFNLLLDKYDIFRTVFSTGTGAKPRQIVLKKRNAQIDYRDISYLSEGEREMYMNTFKEGDKNRGFNLGKDILIRLSLIRMEGTTYKLVLSFHHILIDGWCMKTILTDLFYFYGMLKHKQFEAIKDMLEVRHSFHTYVKWLEMQDHGYPAELWKENLYGFDKQTVIKDLPINTIGDKYDRLDLCQYLDPSLSYNLEKIAKRYNVTVNIVFQTVWAILLQKYTNQDDVVFGTVVSGRPPEINGIEEIVGLFINTIPIRFTTKTDMSFVESLKNIHSRILEIKKIEYYPLADIQTQSDLKNNLFNHLFVFENFPVEEDLERNEILEKIGIKLANTEVFEQTNYDLNCIVYPGKKYRITFTFNTNIYPYEFIGELCERYLKILDTVANNDEVKLSEIEIILVDEKEQIFNQFNNTSVTYAKDKSLHQLFKEQVLIHPYKDALIGADKQLTYSELDILSDKVANSILMRKLPSESKIGLYFDRSVDLIISILGVVKANCAYVPIEPSLPTDRISFIIDDCDIQLILTNKQNAMNLFKQEVFDVPTCYNDAQVFVPTDNPTFSVNQLIYVMYTSGSTGKPKGVLVENINVVRLVNNSNFIPKDNDLRLLLTGAPGFDATTFEIWGMLLNGGCISVIPKHQLLNPDILEELIKAHKINILWLTSSLFNQFVNTNISIFETLSYLLVGGDILSPSHINKVRNRYPQITIINGYGPTENTTFSTTFVIEKEFSKIPIGKPIHNSIAYVLDQNQHLQPVGVIGELYVGGDGIARGYLNDDKLTNEKFIKNPFGQGRLYRTGDLAKWLPDGNIDFYGRSDDQIKIAGFRIEKGEIESAINSINGITKAHVVFDKQLGNGTLIGYYETKENISPEEVTNMIRKKLPEHMIPSGMVQVKEFELNNNGKIDRTKLPSYTLKNREYTPLENDIELSIATIWQEVLDIENIGAFDNYYSLGGDSIKAIPIVSKLKKSNIEIDMRDIFQYQTVRELSDFVIMMKKTMLPNDKRNQKSGGSIVPENISQLQYIMKKKILESFQVFETSVLDQENHSYPVTGGQKGHLLSNFATASIPIPIAMNINDDEFKEAFRILLSQQGLLRSVVSDQGGMLFWKEYQINCNTELPMINISMYTTEVQNQLIEYIENEIMVVQFNHREKLMYNILWIKQSSDKHILFFRMHHSLYDVMSLKIIPNSLFFNYSKVLTNDTQSIKIPIPYQQYAQQINKGPVNISSNEIKRVFQLDEYEIAKSNMVSLLRDRREKVNYIIYRIPLNEGIDENAIFEISLMFFVRILSNYFNLTYLPFSLLSFGRCYCDVKYFETVGEFIDIVPLFIKSDMNQNGVAHLLRERIDIIENHNINFMNMWQENSLRNTWSDVVKSYLPTIEQDNFYDLVFNFQGEQKEEEIAAFEDMLHQQVESGQVMNSMFSAMAEVKYTSSYIHFTLINKVEKDMNVLNQIMNSVMKTLFS